MAIIGGRFVLSVITFSILLLLCILYHMCRRPRRTPEGLGNVHSPEAEVNPKIVNVQRDNIMGGLEGFKYSSETMREELECVICMEEFREHELGSLLPNCGHVYHTECIAAWFSVYSCCPICRTSALPQYTALIKNSFVKPSFEKNVEPVNSLVAGSGSTDDEVGAPTSEQTVAAAESTDELVAESEAAASCQPTLGGGQYPEILVLGDQARTSAQSSDSQGEETRSRVTASVFIDIPLSSDFRSAVAEATSPDSLVARLKKVHLYLWSVEEKSAASSTQSGELASEDEKGQHRSLQIQIDN